MSRIFKARAHLTHRGDSLILQLLLTAPRPLRVILLCRLIIQDNCTV